MLLTILGAGAAAQNPGGACSSYLLRQAETSVVIDMGSGAFANLQRHTSPDEVAAVVISHTHADHVLDLLPYRYWLAFAKSSRRPRLLCPPGGHQTLLAISSMQDPSPTFYQDVFEVEEYDPAQPLRLGALEIAFQAVRHAPHTYAMRVTGAGILAYSADTGPCDDVVDVARGADVFLCENANLEGDDFPMHLTPTQAATYARDAGVRRLLLTHRWHAYDPEAAVRAAAGIYSGPIAIAREGDTYAT